MPFLCDDRDAVGGGRGPEDGPGVEVAPEPVDGRLLPLADAGVGDL